MSDEIEAMVDVPEVIHVAGDYVLRHRGADVGDVREGDLIVVVKQEAAEAGQYVVAADAEGNQRLAVYEDGLTVSGLVVGLMRRLA